MAGEGGSHFFLSAGDAAASRPAPTERRARPSIALIGLAATSSASFRVRRGNVGETCTAFGGGGRPLHVHASRRPYLGAAIAASSRARCAAAAAAQPDRHWPRHKPSPY